MARPRVRRRPVALYVRTRPFEEGIEEVVLPRLLQAAELPDQILVVAAQDLCSEARLDERPGIERLFWAVEECGAEIAYALDVAAFSDEAREQRAALERIVRAGAAVRLVASGIDVRRMVDIERAVLF